MSTILEDIKEMIRVDLSEQIFDTEIMLHINNGVSELINNNIPITNIQLLDASGIWDKISKNDYQLILAWLYYYIMLRFERSLWGKGSTTATHFIEKDMTDLLWKLKASYDL
jgi:hypothetical protein